MQPDRFGVKLFLDDSTAAAIGEARSVVSIFHSWIQRRAIEDHLLIDVHDYSHIHNGPGILLVAHEGNFSMDAAAGRMGLVYFRKQPLAGSAEDRLVAIVKTALQACRLLEDEPALKGKIRFRTDELLIIANDRLHAPNDSETFQQLESVVSAALKRVFNGTDFTLTHARVNPKERFAIRATVQQ